MGPLSRVPRRENEISRDETRREPREERAAGEEAQARLVPADDPQVESRWVQRPVGQRTREPRQAGRQAGRRAATRPLHYTYTCAMNTRTRAHAYWRTYVATRIHTDAQAHTFPRDRTRPRAPPLRTPRGYTGCPVATDAYFNREIPVVEGKKMSRFAGVSQPSCIFLSFQVTRCRKFRNVCLAGRDVDRKVCRRSLVDREIENS